MYNHYYRNGAKGVLGYLHLDKDISNIEKDSLAPFFQSLSDHDANKVIEDILENEDAKAAERQLWRNIPHFSVLTSRAEFERNLNNYHPAPQSYWRSQLIEYLQKEGIEYDETTKKLKFPDQKLTRTDIDTQPLDSRKKDVDQQVGNQITREYFHVRIIRTRDMDNDAVEFDLNKNELLDRIVNRYNEEGSTTLTCGGYLIKSSDIEEIKIYLTAFEHTSLRNESELRLGPVDSMNSLTLASKWKIIENRGKNVTEKFVTFSTNPWHDRMLVCQEGHIVNTSNINRRENNRTFCVQCGKKTTTTCEACNNHIKGDQYKPFFQSCGISPVPPDYCDSCGKKFPWSGVVKKEESLSEDPIEWLDNLFEKFHAVVKQLGRRHDNRPTVEVSDEYDVQDILHSLLRLRFNDIRQEDPTPIYAGGSARMDFLLKVEKIVIEVKITKRGHEDRKIGEELMLDISKYASRPDCKTLVCFIYDKDGLIQNKLGLKTDLEARSIENPKVHIVISS
jgi:hypothetical protein